MSSNVKPMSSDDQSVPRNASNAHVEAGGKKRSERLRARRDEAGLAQVSGWVPKDRRAFAREVLAALSRGSNSLPPDPDQAARLKVVQAALEAAEAEVAAVRGTEAVARETLMAAQQDNQVLTAELGAVRTELDVARAEVEVALDARRQAETAALAQVKAAKAEATLAQATAEHFQKAPGLRGRAIRWLAKRNI